MVNQILNPDNYVLSIYAFPTSFLTVAILILCPIVLIRERGSVVSLLFAVMGLMIGLWFFAFTGMYCATSEDVALWWAKFAYLGVSFIPAAIYHFMVGVLRIYESWKKLVWFSWILSLIFCIAIQSTDSLIVGLYHYWWGYYPKYGWLNVPFIGYFATIMCVSWAHLLSEYRMAQVETHRQRIKLFMIGFGIAYLGTIDYVAKYGVAVYPLGYVPIFTFIFISAFTIWKYRLVDLTPAFAAERILDTMQGAVLVVDLEGIIRLTNRATCALLGYKESELLGQPLSMIHVSPSQLELRTRQFSKNWAVRDQETMWRSKDGRDINVSVSASAVADVPRMTLGVVYVGVDVSELKQTAKELQKSKEILETRVQERTIELTRVNEELVLDTIERKRAEEALRESEERFRLALQAGQMGTFDCDITTNVNYWSPELECIFGLVPGTFGGTFDAFVNLIHPDDVKRVIRTIDDAKERLSTYDFEFRILKPGEDDETWIAGQGQVFPDEHGRPYRLTGVAYDVTDRKRAEEALRQSESKVLQLQKMEAIGNLAGGIAHDFNNILGSIFGYTDLAITKLHRHSDVHGYLQKVTTAGHRAKELVQQILAFSRQTELDRQPLCLHLVVKETLQLLRATLPTTIQIRSYLATESDTILGNATQIHQVLVNLCTNAEHAMRDKGGILEVRLQHVEVTPELAAQHTELQPGPHVRLTVRDTGDGMSPHVMKRIFEPFFTTKGVGQGTGMGLAVVHGIIMSHNGVITVDSTMGEGTTFTLYFPHMQTPLLDMPIEESTVLRGRGSILLIDDEEMLAEAVQKLLIELGYEVVAQTNGLEALKIFHADPFRFDVVITDQTMPNITGEKLAHFMLAIRPDLPIILCTGFSHTMTPEKAHRLGIREYLTKPVMVNDLSKTLHKVLTRNPGHFM